MSNTRVSGFYWVEFKGVETVARWFIPALPGNEITWSVWGMLGLWKDTDFNWISDTPLVWGKTPADIWVEAETATKTAIRITLDKGEYELEYVNEIYGKYLNICSLIDSSMTDNPYEKE